jgi:flavin-dependent dehydrogenase
VRPAFASFFTQRSKGLSLADGSRIGVVGGGPAGSLFAYFLRGMSESAGLDVSVDVYEPRFFTHRGPAGCNHCGGVVSESLVQLLATEGIRLPAGVVQHGIESYVLHTDVGDVRIEAPRHEKRIAAVYRGSGPRHSSPLDVAGFDAHLLELAANRGAKVVRKLVNGLDGESKKPRITTADGAAATYDLVVIASGVNSHALELLAAAAPRYRRPRTVRTFVCEFHLGRENVGKYLGDSMHIFLLDIPRLECAALIPKGECATLCLLGKEVDEALVESFLATAEVKRCFPERAVPRPACLCFPRVNVSSAARPFADRLVWVGDSGATRFYKDGIGSAYRTAKAAARTAVFEGISAADFEKHFWPECRSLVIDNEIAKVVFGLTALMQKMRFLRRGVLRMAAAEQADAASKRDMSNVLWDVFTGSAPYKEILLRTFHPRFPLRLGWNALAGNLESRR